MTTISVTHPELVKALVKNPIDIFNTLNAVNIDLWHGATGVAGETGELLEAFVLPAHVPGTEPAVDRINVREELGDIYFYVEQIVQRSGVVLDWDDIYAFANHAEISPDLALNYAALQAVFGSQVLDTVKKAAIYNKPLDLEMLRVQLTRMLCYVVTIGIIHGITHSEALRANIQKLSKRYAGLQYSDSAAQQRLDKQHVEPARQFFGKPKLVDGPPVSVPHTKDASKEQGKLAGDYRNNPEGI